MRRGLLAIVLLAGPAFAQAASPMREQRERELALVRHIHRHIVAPGDGLALAADRRDLQRMRIGTPDPPLPPPPVGADQNDDTLLKSLAVLADLWQARVNERVPFARMRERSASLARAQQALGQLQSRAGNSDRDDFLVRAQDELQALTRFAAGQGEVSEAGIDLALAVADQASSGRPAAGPGTYPAGPAGPGQSPPAPGGAGAAAAYPPPVPSPLMPPLPPTPPPAPTSGPTPYALPPGYAGYTAEAATTGGTIGGCQVLRQSAGAAASASNMLRVAECWNQLTTWRGWAIQTEEALDWAMEFAKLDRDCQTLGDALDKLRELGKPMAASGAADVTALTTRGESDRRRLKGTGQCRERENR
jgi:hypothetical protein